jgi:hypothetical protein
MKKEKEVHIFCAKICIFALNYDFLKQTSIC